MYATLMETFGYTPNEISDMTPEQTVLGYRKATGQETGGMVHCRSLAEARKFLMKLGKG